MTDDVQNTAHSGLISSNIVRYFTQNSLAMFFLIYLFLNKSFK